MICRKKDDLGPSISTKDSCQSCIANRKGQDTAASYSHSLFRSLWIKSSLIGDNMIQHNQHNHQPKSHDMELYEDNYELKWADQEFYEDDSSMSSPDSPMDIWKKFDLGDVLMTPPSSPEHEPQHEVLHSLDCPFSLFDLLDDRLPAVSKVPETCEKCGPLNTKLIQDCMWSAAQPTMPEPAPTRTPNPTSKASLLKTSQTSTDINANSCSTGNRNRTYSSTGEGLNSSDCVDPRSVFPFPLSDTTVKGGLVGAQSCIDTPSPSESEDEEIDVVTVPVAVRRSTRPTTSAHGSSSTTMSAQVAAIHNYHSSTAQSVQHLDHHYSAPYTQSAPQSPSNQHHGTHSPSVSVLKRSRPSSSMPCSPQPPSKRHRSSHNVDENLKRACQKLYRGHGARSGRSSHANSRTSSDSEEGEGKRAQHNVLERKRRNDLKFSFCKLRAHIPEISASERTPKVTILKKASDHVLSLRHRHASLENELARQKAKHEQLKQKLAQLRRADLSFL